ncbi:MAG: hypothetical protein ACOC5L_03835 [Halobacteriota archaeon]
MVVSDFELRKIMKDPICTREDGLELLEDYYKTLQEQDCEILEDAEIIS